jgi:transposase
MIYEKFLFDMLSKLRADPRTCDQRIVLLMDNVAFHKHEAVMKTCMAFEVNVLFNVEYSPMLNPIERVFNTIKASFRHQLNNAYLK